MTKTPVCLQPGSERQNKIYKHMNTSIDEAFIALVCALLQYHLLIVLQNTEINDTYLIIESLSVRVWIILMLIRGVSHFTLY